MARRRRCCRDGGACVAPCNRPTSGHKTLRARRNIDRNGGDGGGTVSTETRTCTACWSRLVDAGPEHVLGNPPVRFGANVPQCPNVNREQNFDGGFERSHEMESDVKRKAPMTYDWLVVIDRCFNKVIHGNSYIV